MRTHERAREHTYACEPVYEFGKLKNKGIGEFEVQGYSVSRIGMNVL